MDLATGGQVRGQHVGGVVRAERQAADRGTDDDGVADPGGLGVDDDQLATHLVGGGDVEATTGVVNSEGIDADGSAGGDLDGADALGGDVDDRDVDVGVTGATGEHPLAVGADGERAEAGGERVRGQLSTRGDVDNRDTVELGGRDRDVGAVFGGYHRKRLAVHGQVPDAATAGLDQRHHVVGVAGGDQLARALSDVGDGTATNLRDVHGSA
ncbi:hypothetical protein [Mycolicibacterium sp. CBMA 361]|uniref:hypothetical protein n=1 Tax=Mycolicibacterium sp. CBMA 361 TaxID=2606610 RepID=UPI0013AC8808|nr:hypothetical protein [Mycolicibacterium sp. CBMA 361]MUM31276.1 hypothetical protein [Mycolicibacterium sp. CBMA 361]